jgi:hypothetical protein
VTVTSTIYSTPTATISVVSTDIVDATATNSAHTTVVTIIDETATSTAYLTSTATQFITVSTIVSTGALETRSATSTKTNTATATTTATNLVTLVARQAAPTSTTIVPSSLPPYATPCSGTIEFASACSCLGIIQQSTVLPSPSTTITVPFTLTTATVVTTVYATVPTTSVSTATVVTTDSTATVSITVGTETVTVVDGTSSTSRTVSTQTTSIVQSTQTLVSPISTRTSTTTTTTMTIVTTVATVQTIQTLATTTSTAIATTLTPCAGAVPTFALQVRNSPYNGRFLGQFKGFNGKTDVYTNYADASLTLAGATRYHLVGTSLYDAEGRVYCGRPNDNTAYYMQFLTQADKATVGHVDYPCTRANGLLTCSVGTKNTFYVCPAPNRDFIDLAPPGQPAFSWCDQTAIDLVVVPVCKF